MTAVTEVRQIDVITGPASVEPCCPVQCVYTTAAVGYYRTLRDLCRAHDLDPIEAAFTLIHVGQHSRAELGVLSGLAPGGGESAQQRWADRIADVERAERAGCATDEQVSRFLCPFGPEGAP